MYILSTSEQLPATMETIPIMLIVSHLVLVEFGTLVLANPYLMPTRLPEYYDETAIEANSFCGEMEIPCGKGLICDTAHGECVCPFFDQIFQPSSEKCVGIYNGQCRDEVWNECEGELICGESGKCICPIGLLYENKTCLAEYGATCNDNITCRSSLSLACVEGVCSCKDDYWVLDKSSGRCLKAEGADCDTSMDISEDYGTCAGSTVCVPIAEGSPHGVCRKRDYDKMELIVTVFLFVNLILFIFLIRSITLRS